MANIAKFIELFIYKWIKKKFTQNFLHNSNTNLRLGHENRSSRIVTGGQVSILIGLI